MYLKWTTAKIKKTRENKEFEEKLGKLKIFKHFLIESNQSPLPFLGPESAFPGCLSF